MIEHAWSIVCTKCIVDPSTNNATLMEVIEQLNVREPVPFPILAPFQMDIVSVWYRSDFNHEERGTARFCLINPDGTNTTPTEYGIDLTRHFRARTIGRIAGIPLVAPGLHFFKVELRVDEQNWREVARIPLVVALADAPMPAAGS